jgi:hypothetical protein
MHRSRLQHDQPGPAFGPRPVIGDEVVGRQVVAHERRLVRGRDDAVRDLDRPELERGEKVPKHRPIPV